MAALSVLRVRGSACKLVHWMKGSEGLKPKQRRTDKSQTPPVPPPTDNSIAHRARHSGGGSHGHWLFLLGGDMPVPARQ